MALTDSIPVIYGGVLRERFYQENVWIQFVRDYSGEFLDGDTFKIPVDNSTYSLNTISKANYQSNVAANHQRGTPAMQDTTQVSLILDQVRELDQLISNSGSTQVRPDLMAAAMDRDVRAMNEDINAHVRGTVSSAAGVTDVSAITTTVANYGNDAHISAIDKAFRGAAKLGDERHWPRDRRFAVVSPSTYDLLDEHLLGKNYFVVPETNQALVQRRDLVIHRGFRVVMDDSVGSGEGADDDAKHTIYYGLVGSGIAHAQQLRNIRVFMSEVYRGQRITGDLAYGTLVDDANKLLKTTLTINA